MSSQALPNSLQGDPIDGYIKRVSFAEGERIFKECAAGKSIDNGLICGAGHKLIEPDAIAVPASRIIADSRGVVGLTTALSPSLTLGCGYFGVTSTTNKVTFTHLTNVRCLAEFVPPSTGV